MNEKVLCEVAKKAMLSAYAPYSGYKVGAALLTKSGKVYTGCNIENAAYSPSVCAERVAFFKAVSEGEREFKCIAVCGGKDGKLEGEFPPCGVCRQVMAEFCDFDEFEILFVSEKGCTSHKLREILPFGFSNDYMG